MRILLLLFFLGQCCVSISQEATKEFALDDYIKVVRENHPVFYQSSLLDQMAESNLLMARGGFDPKLEGGLDRKSFDGKNYYNIVNTGLKIPTWYGIKVKAGYDRATGVFLDDSDELPASGLFYGGISVPLAKGLLLDQRRAELAKAKIFVESSMAMQRIMKNEVMYEALEAYLMWQEAYYTLQVAADGIIIAENRFDASVSSFVNGDKPAIDTLESLIAVQNRNIDLSKAEQDLVKAVYHMNNFLWMEGDTPVVLEEGVSPEILSDLRFASPVDSLFLLKDDLLRAHPELLTYNYKLEELDIERRLAVETLKPELRVGYNPLYETSASFLPTENYKLGISASYPLFIRKGRGKLGMTNAKISDTGYERSLKQNSLSNKLEMYYRLQDQLADQNDLIATTVDNYQRMVAAENRRFSIGESSVFLVNSREIKYLDSRYKLVEGQSKRIQAKLLFLLYSGMLDEVI